MQHVRNALTGQAADVNDGGLRYLLAVVMDLSGSLNRPDNGIAVSEMATPCSLNYATTGTHQSIRPSGRAGVLNGKALCVGPVKPAVAGEQLVGLAQGVRANQEISGNSRALPPCWR